MQYPIQALDIILLHILCPNHQKYVGLRRGSLDNVFDYERGEVNCQNECEEFLFGYVQCASWMKRGLEEKANCSTVTVTNFKLYLMTAKRKALLERTSLYVV